ncbi:MAG: hypothetical protein M9945_06825 [Aquamicrobium sp.]|uniref:hypothetical protein n=1 Tax=Aquamicrobium sp. TaxID=1872579 RepID=UPI00349E4F65|nr:hypothetical protein [Aquamicrobium sp.]
MTAQTTALRKHIHILAATTLLSAATFAGASAQEVEAAAERLQTYVADQGFKIEWDGIDLDTDGSSGILVGVRAGNDEAMVPVGNIRLAGVTRDDKGYRVERITLADFSGADDEEEVRFAAEGIELGNVLLPDEDKRDNYGGFLFYETFALDRMALTIAGTDVFTMGDMHFEVTEPDGDTPMDFSGAAESFTVDLSLMEDENQLAVMEALGLKQMKGYMEVEGSWNPNDGRLAFSQYDMTVVEAGTLGFTFDLGGYTPSLIASLRELQKQMAENPDSDNSAQGLAILGLLQQMTFHSAEISFADDTLTNKVLDFVAKNQGMRAADIANQAKAVVPFALAQLNNPELTAQASQAVSTFLDDPQSLTVSARPAQPVPFALLMATAMTTPVELTKSLGVTVTAND